MKKSVRTMLAVMVFGFLIFMVCSIIGVGWHVITPQSLHFWSGEQIKLIITFWLGVGASTIFDMAIDSKQR